MSGPFWTLCGAVGAVVLVCLAASTVWFLLALCGAAIRDRRAREWVADEQRRRRGDYPSRRGRWS